MSFLSSSLKSVRKTTAALRDTPIQSRIACPFSICGMEQAVAERQRGIFSDPLPVACPEPVQQCCSRLRIRARARHGGADEQVARDLAASHRVADQGNAGEIESVEDRG